MMSLNHVNILTAKNYQYYSVLHLAGFTSVMQNVLFSAAELFLAWERVIRKEASSYFILFLIGGVSKMFIYMKLGFIETYFK
jgi:hypothetical protein